MTDVGQGWLMSSQGQVPLDRPSQTIEFEFTLNYPDVFMYHCGTPMILEHIASGMYGACSALIHRMSSWRWSGTAIKRRTSTTKSESRRTRS